MILLDSTAFALLVNPDAQPPIDPNTQQPVERARERFLFLAAEVQRKSETIVIPTPALAEVLVRAGDAGPDILERITRSSRLKIADFDTVAAVELAAMTREAIQKGDKKAGSTEPWQKIKIDRQIIAIAKTRNCHAIYSDDHSLGSFAESIGLKVVRTWTMTLPPAEPQLELPYAPKNDQ